MTPVAHVYTAIAAITHALAKEGISKDRKNDSQGYKFRGIDDVLNALSGLLAEHKLCIIPKVVERACVEHKNAKGTTLFYVTVKVEFYLVSAVDGSAHIATLFGEAMDSGDKATNKAMSAAYKYMALLLFCIPTEGDNDADATTHTVQAGTGLADNPTLATDAQVAMLEDFTNVDNIKAPVKARIAELLADHKAGKLTKARAAEALNKLTEKKS